MVRIKSFMFSTLIGLNALTQVQAFEKTIKVQWDDKGKFEQTILSSVGVGQWTYIELEYPEKYQKASDKMLINMNDKRAILNLSLNCIEPDEKSKFVIEDHRGLDRLNAEQSDLDILLDGQSYGNPFLQGAVELEKFKQAILSAKKIQFNADAYGAPYHFVNQNSDLLLTAVTCS